MKLSDKTEYLNRIAKFFLPFIIGFGVYGVWALFDDTLSRIWPLLIAYFFPPLGKETIIPLGIGFSKKGVDVPLINFHIEPLNVDPLAMALSVAFIDIIVALFLMWNYDLAKKIPLIGRFMIKVENIGKHSSDKYAWVKPLRFIGIILFVMVPFQGSGGLVGSILGRLIGMKPVNTFLAISSGAILGCLLLAYFADAILNVFIQNFLYGLSIVIVLLVLGIMIYIYRKNKSNNKK